MSQNITIKDMAERLGVVPSTVSAALNDTGRISPERRRIIRQAAAEIGYYPKTAARLLRSRQTGRIGLLMSGCENLIRTIVSGFGGPMVSCFIEYCDHNQTQYDLEFIDGHDEVNEQSFMPPQQFISGLVDGVLIAGHPGQTVCHWLQTHKQVPWISLDEPAEYEVAHAIDQGTHRAVEHLVALGHRRIGYIGGPERYRMHLAAWQSFVQANKDFELNVPESWIRREAAGTVADRRDLAGWLQAMFDTRDRPTAILAVVDGSVVTAVAQGRGLRVPEDLSVLAYGVAALAEINYPALTTIEPDYKRMIELAMDMLKRRIAGWPIPQRVLYVTPQLIRRDSTALCAPPKSAATA